MDAGARNPRDCRDIYDISGRVDGVYTRCTLVCFSVLHVSTAIWSPTGEDGRLYIVHIVYTKGLKYNFKVGELFSSPPPSSFGVPIYILGPCFNSDYSNYQWSTGCIWFHVVFFQFCKILKNHALWIYDRDNVNFEWLINCRIIYTIAKVANLLRPGTRVSTVKSKNIAAETLQASGPRNSVSVYFNPW